MSAPHNTKSKIEVVQSPPSPPFPPPPTPPSKGSFFSTTGSSDVWLVKEQWQIWVRPFFWNAKIELLWFWGLRKAENFEVSLRNEILGLRLWLCSKVLSSGSLRVSDGKVEKLQEIMLALTNMLRIRGFQKERYPLNGLVEAFKVRYKP
jgi:hypothetical protein